MLRMSHLCLNAAYINGFGIAYLIVPSQNLHLFNDYLHSEVQNHLYSVKTLSRLPSSKFLICIFLHYSAHTLTSLNFLYYSVCRCYLCVYVLVPGSIVLTTYANECLIYKHCTYNPFWWNAIFCFLCPANFYSASNLNVLNEVFPIPKFFPKHLPH